MGGNIPGPDTTSPGSRDQEPPDAFAHDVERPARFEHEANVLASFNHPNITIIHELKEAGGSKYLILELWKARRSPSALPGAGFRSEGSLDMPGQWRKNSKRRMKRSRPSRSEAGQRENHPEGRVEVLDFGLAKIRLERRAAEPSNSPTLSAVQTANGIVSGHGRRT